MLNHQKTQLLAFLALFILLPAFSAAETQYVIGFPEDNLSNDWRAAQMREIQNELKKHPNVKFLMADAGGSIAKNLLDIDNMVKQGVQLLFLGPRNPESIELIAKKLRQQGIRIVLLTRRFNTEDYDVYISPDDFEISYNAAKFIAVQLHGMGRVLMLEGVPTTSTAIRRKHGFMAGLDNYPSIKGISRVANYSRSKAIRVVENVLKQGIKFDAIYAHNDAMAAGARFALKKAGIKPGSIPTIGIDFLPETKEAIINGEQTASFTYPTVGKVGVDVALKLLKGEKVPRYITVPSQLVTSENVKDIKPVY